MNTQVRAAGEVSVISGNMTMDNAAALLTQGTTALEKGVARFDLAAVAEIDSSGLAVLFAWLRAARLQGKMLSIDNPPHALRSLAGVYGVTELLPLS